MKKLIVGTKDENGAYMKAPESPSAPTITMPKIDNLSLDDFLKTYLDLLERETRSLFIEASQGKLSKDSSQCMRDNLKLIIELKKQEKAFLDDLSDGDLKKLAKKSK